MKKLLSNLTLEEFKNLIERLLRIQLSNFNHDYDLANLQVVYDINEHFTPLEYFSRIALQNLVTDYLNCDNIEHDFNQFKKMNPNIEVEL